jgi:hypothetical protein
MAWISSQDLELAIILGRQASQVLEAGSRRAELRRRHEKMSSINRDPEKLSTTARVAD